MRMVLALLLLVGCGPGWADCYSEGEQAYGRNRIDEAIYHFTDCINDIFLAEKRRAQAFRYRGQMYEKKKRYDQAIQDYTKALKLNPRDIWCYNRRGVVYKKKGQYNRAVEDYTRAIKLDSNSAVLYNNRGNAYKKMGHYSRAIRDYSRAIKLDPNDAAFYNNFSWLLASCTDSAYRNGRLAVDLGVKANDLENWRQADYIDTLAAAYAESGRFDKAIEYQEQAISMLSSSDKATRKIYQERLHLYKTDRPVFST